MTASPRSSPSWPYGGHAAIAGSIRPVGRDTGRCSVDESASRMCHRPVVYRTSTLVAARRRITTQMLASGMDAHRDDETTLHAIEPTDAADVLRFELENRAYFEETLPPRAEHSYTPSGVERAIAVAVDDRRHDRAYGYLIRNRAGELVGRVNLVDIERGPVQSAQLGYRIARKHGRRGHATRAVDLAVCAAFDDHDLRRIEAATAPTNRGSQIVLVRNGFEFWGRAHRSLMVRGAWVDSVYFERHRDDDP